MTPLSNPPHKPDISFVKSNYFTPLQGWDAALIQNAKIMVIGAGALGNEVLKNLALIGVKNILIVDFDFIEHTNLAKSVLYREEDCTGDLPKVDIAEKRIKEIAPDLKTMTINGDVTIDVGLGVYREMDVVISCLDNKLARRWVNRFCFSLGKKWVDGGLGELSGQVDVYDPKVNCYECSLSLKSIERIAFREGCINKVRRYATAGLASTNILAASITAAVQTQEALKIVANKGKSLSGSQFYFDGHDNYYDTLGRIPPRKKSCASHKRYEPIFEATELSADKSIEETLAWLETHFQSHNISIALHYILTTSVKANSSGLTASFIKPRNHISDEDLQDFQNRLGAPVSLDEWTDHIDQAFPDKTITLHHAGIPYFHILDVIVDGKNHYISLAADKHFVNFK